MKGILVVVEFDNDDEEYQNGFKWQIQWFDEYFDDEEELDG